MRRYFCGEAAAKEEEEEAAAEAGADNGAHRLRFGDAGLSSGSKSRVLFKVAPQAMARGGGGGGAEEGGSERGAGETAAAAGPAQRRLPRCLGRAGGEGREGGRERRGQLRQGLRRLPCRPLSGERPRPPPPAGSPARPAGSPPPPRSPPAALPWPGQIPPAAGGGAAAGPRGAGPGPATRSGAADDERWRRGPGGGGGGASLCDSHTSNMASITTPRIQKPAPRTAPAFLGRWRPQRLRGLVVSPPRPRGSAAGSPPGRPDYKSRRAPRRPPRLPGSDLNPPSEAAVRVKGRGCGGVAVLRARPRGRLAGCPEGATRPRGKGDGSPVKVSEAQRGKRALPPALGPRGLAGCGRGGEGGRGPPAFTTGAERVRRRLCVK